MILGYVLSRFPLITETFIAREVVELERRGATVWVAPLRREAAAAHHPSSRALLPRLRPIRRSVAAHWAHVVRANLTMWRRHPRRYVEIWRAALAGSRGDRNLQAGALLFWPRVVAIAYDFERLGVEHVHAHFATHPALAALIVHRLTGIPFSFTVHAHDLFAHPCMLPEKMAAARFVVTISHFNRRRLLALAAPGNTHALAAKLHVVRCGVRCEDYATARAISVAPPGVLRLLTVASLQPYKGHAVLLAACTRLSSPFELRLIGNGPLRSRLEAEARRLGLGDRVLWLGAQDERQVRRALADCDVFVLPSVVEPSGRMEGIPVALIEAMAAGRAIVATRLSGIPELVASPAEGCLVPPGDAAALAAALAALVDPERRRRMGRAAQRKVNSEFHLAPAVAQLEELFAASGAVFRRQQPLAPTVAATSKVAA